MRNFLELLGDKYMPSKRKAGYLPYYDFHLSSVRHEVRKVLEIGVERGNSLRMWEEYFPNATIYGLDIKPECCFSAGRIQCLCGDQGDPSILKRLAELGPYDLVIDDGSHHPPHQVAAMEALLPLVHELGYYVVEDIAGFDRQATMLNRVKQLLDGIMYWPPEVIPADWPYIKHLPGTSWYTQNVIGVSVYRWIAFIVRGPNPEFNPYLTDRHKA